MEFARTNEGIRSVEIRLSIKVPHSFEIAGCVRTFKIHLPIVVLYRKSSMSYPTAHTNEVSAL